MKAKSGWILKIKHKGFLRAFCKLRRKRRGIRRYRQSTVGTVLHNSSPTHSTRHHRISTMYNVLCHLLQQPIVSSEDTQEDWVVTRLRRERPIPSDATLTSQQNLNNTTFYKLRSIILILATAFDILTHSLK